MSAELPRGWTTATLKAVVGDTGVFSDGDWVESKDQDPNGPVRLVQLADIGDGRFLDKSARFMTDDKAAALGCTELRANDVLISRMAEPMGRACLFPGSERRCVTVVDVCIVRPEPSRVDPRWLVSAVNAPTFRRKVEGAASGTTRARISRTNLGELDLGLPPLNEQRRIVAKLEALQARSRRAREALDAVPALLEKLRQSILAAAFRGDLTKDWRAKNPNVEPASELLKRIRVERRAKWEEAELAKMVAKGKPPKDDKWKAKYEEPKPVDATGLPELPEGWCWASVDQMLDQADDLFDGPFGSALKSTDYTSVGARVVRLENLANLEFKEEKRSYVSLEKYSSLRRHSVHQGDIMFGSFVEETPRVCMLPALKGPAIAKADCFCVRVNGQLLSAELLTFALGSPHSRHELTRGIHGATRPRINTGQLRRLRLPVPPKAEQEALLPLIGSALDRIGGLVRTGAGATSTLSLLDRAILAKAFRGELVPQDPNDEPVVLPNDAEAAPARARSKPSSAKRPRRKATS